MISNCNNLEDYMAQYGTILGNRTASAVAPLHKPSRDAVIEVDVLREPFEAQAHVISATIKQLRRSKTAIMVGECGTGKTMMAMAACHGHANGHPPCAARTQTFLAVHPAKRLKLCRRGQPHIHELHLVHDPQGVLIQHTVLHWPACPGAGVATVGRVNS